MVETTHRGVSRRSLIKGAAGASSLLVAGSLGFPGIIRAAESGKGPIRLGHLTPRTGFLGQIGQMGVNAARLAVDEINESGGINGRRIEMLAEDSVDPGSAVTKVDQLINREGVVALLGEISSATALAIGEAAKRNQRLYINTGANSDALRGENCNRYMFHVEGDNTMYTKTIGRWQQDKGNIKGARWYFLTADYAFGHDLRRVSQQFFKDNGGQIVGDDLIPTGTNDYSAYILKIRREKPDMIYLNLAGTDQTTFLKQFNEYGLDYPLSGGVMDTAQFWAAGLANLSGSWPSMWYHSLDDEASRAFVERYRERYDQPPENQAWGDYVAMKTYAQAIAETGETRADALIEYFEGGAEFDILKGRPGRFRDWDHQLLQPMYVVNVKDESQSTSQWDIFNIVEPVPGPNQDLEAIQTTQKTNSCEMA